jgi:SHS2 domain-containing protein
MRAKGRRGKGSSRERKKTRSARQPAAPAKKSFRFLDHPADVGFEVRAKSLPEIFAGAALALCDYGWDLATIRPQRSLTLRARAATLEDLLYSWLAEILFLTDAEGWVFRAFRVARVAALAVEGRGAAATQSLWEVVGEARGEKFSKKHHRARTYIKAITYHQLAVKETAGGWRATVFLDV